MISILEKLEKKRNYFVYLPLGIYWLALFIGTSLPGNDVPNLSLGDKYEHFLGYFGLSFLLSMALYFQGKFQLLRREASLFTLLFVSVYGFLDELHQKLVPGRSCDIKDWCADLCGALSAVLIAYLIKTVLSKIK